MIAIDDRTGLVRHLEQVPVPAHFPPSFSLVRARISDPARFCDWPADPSGAGYGFADPQHDRDAAVGEALERYCGNLVPGGLVRASYDDLTARGEDAVDPRSLALFAADQHVVPAVPFTGDLSVEWVEGRSLSDEVVLVPASLVWPSYVTERHGVPLTNPVIQAGLAAGTDRAMAVRNALHEVIERDAMTLSWTGGLDLIELDPPQWLATFGRGPVGALDVRYLGLHSVFGVPVVGALVRDESGDGRHALGVGVHSDPERAALKALAEALQLHLLLEEYDDPDGAFAAAARQPGSPLKPWRADRRYGRAYREDRRDAVDYACHLQLHLDPEVRDRFTAELDERITTGTPLDRWWPAGRSTDPADRLAAAGHRGVVVDVTTPDVRASGITVVRVVVPGLYSNAPMGLPFLGGSRLPAALAVSGRPLPANPLPH